MVDYTNEPGSLRPDGTRVPLARTIVPVRSGMSGTTMGIIAVVVLVVLAFAAWSYSNNTTMVNDAPVADPVVQSTPLPDAAPMDSAPVVEDNVAPLAPAPDAAPTDGAVPLDTAPVDPAPATP